MLSVLMTSPHPSVPGGVSVFTGVLKRHLRLSQADAFYVGSTAKRETTGAQIMRLVTAPLRLVRQVRRKHYDVVHLNPSFDAKAMIRDGLLLLALRATGFRRIIFYLHGWDRGFYQHVRTHFLWRRMIGWLLNRAALVTVLGDEFRDGLVALGVDPARIVVTRTMYEKSAMHEKSDVVLSSPRFSRPFILFMSRFDREKGGRELIDAFVTLTQDYPAYDMVLAGDGEDADIMRAQVDHLNLTGRVCFTGYVGGNAKQLLLQDCAIFALPTTYRSEGMPVAMLEAMAAGKPLLIGSVGAIRAVVRDGVNGVVLDHVTAQTVAQGLRRLLDDPIFMKNSGEHNARQAAERFEASIVSAEIEQLYAKVSQC